MDSKDQEMHELKEWMDKMGNIIMHLDSAVKFYKNQFQTYVEQFGAHALTKSEREKTQEFLEQLKNIPDLYSIHVLLSILSLFRKAVYRH